MPTFDENDTDFDVEMKRRILCAVGELGEATAAQVSEHVKENADLPIAVLWERTRESLKPSMTVH